MDTPLKHPHAVSLCRVPEHTAHALHVRRCAARLSSILFLAAQFSFVPYMMKERSSMYLDGGDRYDICEWCVAAAAAAANGSKNLNEESIACGRKLR
jgi:hypothetical protein